MEHLTHNYESCSHIFDIHKKEFCYNLQLFSTHCFHIFVSYGKGSF